MTITSRFYDTTPGNGIKENEWAVSAVSRGATYGVVGANGLNLTPHPSTPYTLNIGPALEGFWGHGVWDVSDVQVTLPAVTPPATNATRWDLVAARRDWQPTGGGPTALVVVEGATAKALPATRANTPGEVDDQPLWLVQWRGGDTQPIATIDLRCWAANGGVLAVDKLALDYLAVPGADVHINGIDYRYKPDALGDFQWESRETIYREWNAETTVTTVGAGGTKGISFPAGMFTVAPLVQATKQGAQSAKYVPYVTEITPNGCVVGLYSGDGTGATTTTTVAIRAVQTFPSRATGINP